MIMRRGSGEEEAVDLWAMAADLERQFAGYKQRLADRDGPEAAPREHVEDAAAAYDDTGSLGGVDNEDEEEAGISDVMRGRMYEAYVRRRDERLREGWRARMERKEAEVMALWAQLDLTARTGGDPTTTTTTDDASAAAGDERKTETNNDDKRRSSDTALAPRRITGKKHARTRSFSSSIITSRSRSDDERRRAVSQEPPPSEPQAVVEEARKDNRVRSAGGAAATTTPATARPKTSSLRRKSSVKGHVSAKPTGPKLPRSLPRQASSGGGFETLAGEVVLPIAGEAAPVQSWSSEDAGHGETPKACASSPRMFVVEGDSSDVAGAANAQTASPELGPDEVIEGVAHGESEAKDADDVDERCEEKIDALPANLGSPNGEITSDSETEPSCVVYIHKDTAKQEQAMAVSEPLKLASSDAVLVSDVRTSEEIMPAPAGATAVEEIATTNAEEAPARESSDESPFSVRSGLRSARPSWSSRDQSIERLLEADAVLVRRKREERAEKKSGPPKTPPGSAGSRISGAARSPRETVRGFKRFLSFGKKNRGREVTVIECTSPSVPSSLADDDSASGGWQSAGSIKPRMGSCDAASDDTEHGYAVSPRASCSLQSLVAASPAKSEHAEIVPQEKSPKAHRSFFSFRSLNCGRG